MNIAIRTAVEDDLPYVVHLQERNRESVGHLPKPAIVERIKRNTLVIGTLNGDPYGYILFDSVGGIVRIHQACIQYDIRRQLYGAALYAWLESAVGSVREIHLRCAADLEANLFWRTMGFTPVNVSQGGRRRGRLINSWIKPLAHGFFSIETFAIVPAAQQRVDCMYEDTDYMMTVPDGFVDGGSLGKLAWDYRVKP